jgi:glutamate-1-semialdehyde 2,1-aminomutase
MDTPRSDRLFERARRVTPGGVNSPVRAFGSVGGTPRFIARGEGCHLYDADGNRYLDMVGSWGPLLLGSAHPAVVEALRRALPHGTSFGAPTEDEVRLAESILERVRGTDRVRFVNSGTEATMSAIRVARGVTGRDRLVKFEGNYHGHGDSLLVAAGSGALTTGVPSSAGVPRGTAADTLVARYNDLDSLRALFEAHEGTIAAVILEPVAGNMGVVPPAPGFLEGVRELTRANGTAMIVDEVMTGFRIARGGAVERYDLEPDLVTWGKVIGGGLPVGAYGGKARFMDAVSPLGPVYQAGTLSGNPLAMAAGLATLAAVDEAGDVYEALEERGRQLEEGLAAGAADAGIDVWINRVGSMLTVFFTAAAVQDFAGATATDRAAFARWFHGLLERGVYWPASPFEAAFLSYAHGPADVDAIVEAAAEAFEDAAAGS